MAMAGGVYLVTGGSSGLGAATVRMVVAEGARAVIADTNVQGGNALCQELGAAVRFVETDVSNEGGAQRAVNEVLEAFGSLNGLVNCAGIGPAERVVGRDGPHRLEIFQRVLAVNLVGTFNMIRLCAQVMSRARANDDGERGVIVNTASVAAFDGQIGQAAYSASKGGIVAMTLPLARELARFGIRVMTIAPGLFETPMLLGLPKEVQDSLGNMVPFPQRLGRPAEYAALVRHIIQNPMLNGEVIRLDGAIRMQPK